MAFKYDTTLTSIFLQDNHSDAIKKLFANHEAKLLEMQVTISNRVHNLLFGPKPQNERELESILKEIGLDEEQIELVKKTIET